MVERFEKSRKMGAQDPCHHKSHGEDDGCGAKGEAGVVEEGVEHDAEAFSAVQETEAVEGFEEEHLGCSLETDGHGGEDTEYEA